MKKTEQELAEQTSLTETRLKKCLTPDKIIEPGTKRPENSLVDLIHWVQDEFCKDQLLSSSFLHNKIAIDGTFLCYCDQQKVDVKCIYRDSIASWKDDHDTEGFMAQGIFEISFNLIEQFVEGVKRPKRQIKFLHCSLFHKGTQNEDEVSFFVVVNNSDYNDYIIFRNNYEAWKLERETSTREIYVVGGESISYDCDLSWDDLIVSNDLKKEIKDSIEGFLNAESFYKENRIPWKRGMIFFGEPGCGKTQTLKIILSEYNFKPVTIMSGNPQKDMMLAEAFQFAEDHGPSLLFLEDLPELLNGVDESHFLQLLDGVSSHEGLLVIATANDLSGIKSSLTDRPSRFDRKIHFPLPDKEMTIKFLKTRFKNIFKQKEYNDLAQKIMKHKFSFAYLKELYVTSAHIAISKNRKQQNYNDVEEALSILTKDKGYVQTGFGLSRRSMDIEDLFE